jgi:hypothetical protein
MPVHHRLETKLPSHSQVMANFHTRVAVVIHVRIGLFHLCRLDTS